MEGRKVEGLGRERMTEGYWEGGKDGESREDREGEREERTS